MQVRDGGSVSIFFGAVSCFSEIADHVSGRHKRAFGKAALEGIIFAQMAVKIKPFSIPAF